MDDVRSLPHVLPPHMMVTMDGEPTNDECPGGEPDGIEEDVGLVNTLCSHCRAPFVFSYKKNTWVPDTDFEEDLLNNNPLDDPDVLS